MKYKYLGESGLEVSALALGTMTFGDGASEKESGEIYSLARSHGINHFDCANVYGNGESERILGRLMQSHRSEVVLSTKAYYPMGELPNERGLSRLHIRNEIHNSLRRLQTDYIDIFYMHSFDQETPLEETISTLDLFTQQGKILYVGISNFASWQAMKALSIASRYSHVKIVCIQPMYNLLKRQCEVELLPMAKSEQLGVITYGPLAGGMLTGKYLSKIPEDGRLAKDAMYRERYKNLKYINQVEKFITFAKEGNYTPESLAIAWVMKNSVVTSPLIGAKTTKQLETVLRGAEINLPEYEYQQITSFVESPPIATDRSEES